MQVRLEYKSAHSAQIPRTPYGILTISFIGCSSYNAKFLKSRGTPASCSCWIQSCIGLLRQPSFDLLQQLYIPITSRLSSSSSIDSCRCIYIYQSILQCMLCSSFLKWNKRTEIKYVVCKQDVQNSFCLILAMCLFFIISDSFCG